MSRTLSPGTIAGSFLTLTASPFLSEARAQSSLIEWAAAVDSSTNLLFPEAATGAPDDIEFFPSGPGAVGVYSGFGSGDVSSSLASDLATLLGVDQSTLGVLDFIVFEFNGSPVPLESSTWEFSDGVQSVVFVHDIADPQVPAYGSITNADYAGFFGYTNPNTGGEHAFIAFDLDGFGLDLLSPAFAVTVTAANIAALDNPDVDAMGFLRPDLDGDGLSDAAELAIGTDPSNPDTDGDGLMDGTEVDIAEGGGCPDPLDPDSDGDLLLDGEEVAIGTSTCDPDTDGDGVPDDIDPFPTDPNGNQEAVAEDLRLLSEYVQSLPLAVIDAPNANAASGRRNAMTNRIHAAANATDQGDYEAAITILESLLLKLDGDPSPPDWMVASPERDATVYWLSNDLAVLQYL